MNIFERIFHEFNQGKIKYLVVGGIAVNLYGYMRMTGDLDIIIALDEKNVTKLDKIMIKLGYYPRIPVQITELAHKNQVREWLEKKGMKAYTLDPPNQSVLQIDIIIEESLKFEKLYQTKTIKRIHNINIPIINISELINMKKKANRKQDLEDLEALLKLKGL